MEKLTPIFPAEAHLLIYLERITPEREANEPEQIFYSKQFPELNITNM